ncbi:hypothetical protein GOBAR_DD08383 [Gossypium barbadense]|nr:hypothetical protein GOBAR_DD08383 [Gossypium barbadense]
MDFVQWLTWVFEQLTPCQGRLFCYALWAIWGDRNRRIHEEKVSNGKEIANFISNYITELTGFEKRKSVIITENKRWRHPHCEFIKINFDSAYNESQNRSASGIMARDAEGKVLLSCSEIHNDITSAFAAEAIACWKAIEGTPDRPRLCVFRSNKHLYVQVIDDSKMHTLASGSTMQKPICEEFNYTSGPTIEVAKKVGEFIAKSCLEKGITKVAFDRGGYPYHGRVQALADSAREHGLQF